MKTLKKNLIVAILCLSFGLVAFKKDKELPKGPVGTTVTYANMPIFIMTTPANDYEIVKEVRPEKVEKQPAFSGQIITSINEVLAKKAKGKFPEFNAVIVPGRMKKFQYVNVKGDAKSMYDCIPYAYRKTKKYDYKFVYFAAVPQQEYTVVKNFDRSMLAQGGLLVANNAGDPAKVMINSFGEKALRVAKKEGLEFDGIIVKQTTEDVSTALGGNEFGQGLEMIKFK